MTQPMEHDDLHDLLCTAIDDSMDMDWQSGWAADSIISALEREGLTVQKACHEIGQDPPKGERCKHGHFACSECSV